MLEGSVVQVIKENKVVEWTSCEDPICVETTFIKFMEKYVDGFDDWNEQKVNKTLVEGYFDIPESNISIMILDLDSDSDEVKELESSIKD